MATATSVEHDQPPVDVVAIGPNESLVGGMAHVASQIARLDFQQRYRIHPFDLTFRAGETESWVGRIGRHLRALGRLRSLLQSTNAKIVHIHTCSGSSFFRSMLDLAVANTMHVRVVLHIHGAAFDKFHEQAGLIGRRLIGLGLRSADAVVALSSDWQKQLQTMAPGAIVRVVENAVEVRDTVPKARLDSPCHFLLLAKMDEWKGIDDLLDAAARLASDDVPFQLTLAGPPGTAGDEAMLTQKIAARRLEKNVRYVGPLLGVAKEKALAQADVYVQPSHHEGMPISVLEALAHGLPVVATRVGAMPEVITEGREGKLVMPHRPDQLADAMQLLADDPKLREAMSRSASQLATARFSLNRLRDDLVELYDSVTREHRSSPYASATVHRFRGATYSASAAGHS